jgi:hypothetical protein
VDEDEGLRRYGLRPVGSDLDAIRQLLAEQTEQEHHRQGDADTALMKLCCVQLFNAGVLADVLAIWQAKESSWDAHCSVDVQLLCGAGMHETKTYLQANDSTMAAAALDYLQRAEEAGDFADFSIEGQSRWYSRYYLGDSNP